MSETSIIKRVGSAEVVSKNGEDLWVHIKLSGSSKFRVVTVF